MNGAASQSGNATWRSQIEQLRTALGSDRQDDVFARIFAILNGGHKVTPDAGLLEHITGDVKLSSEDALFLSWFPEATNVVRQRLAPLLDHAAVSRAEPFIGIGVSELRRDAISTLYADRIDKYINDMARDPSRVSDEQLSTFLSLLDSAYKHGVTDTRWIGLAPTAGLAVPYAGDGVLSALVK